MPVVKSREMGWEGWTEMPVRTEQVITHPHSSFHGQGLQLLWDTASLLKHKTPRKVWQEELGPPALPAAFRNPLPPAQFLYPQVDFVLFF